VFRSLDKQHFLENYYGFRQPLTSAEERKRLFRTGAEDEQEMFAVFSGVSRSGGGTYRG
jgi:hypothetical protein